MSAATAQREIGVGLLGLGNVGAGVVKLLEGNAEAIQARLGAAVRVRRIVVREADKPRLVEVEPGLVTTDAAAAIDDPRVDLVVELVGGTTDAGTYVRRAIARGKHVVTANKALLATAGDELHAAAEAAGVDLYFEAAVCGGLPIIRTLREGLASDRIEALYGIVNGTSNYILTRMADERLPFAEALAAAQAAGYAEADPTLDVEGGDAAHKLAILAMLSFGTRIRLGEIHVEGIAGIEPIDLAYAERFGYVIRPLAIARAHPDGIEARVHPSLVPRRWMLAGVAGVNNAVYVTSQALGQSMYYGRGAGMMPTAVAVVADVIEVARDVLARAGAGGQPSRPLRRWTELPILPIGRVTSRYYLRFAVADRPGVLAQLAGILAEHDISLAQVVQDTAPASPAADAPSPEPVHIVVLTHLAREEAVRAALARIDRLPVVAGAARLLRIVE